MRDDLGGRSVCRFEPSAVVSSSRLVPGLASNTFLRGGQVIEPWPDLQRFAVTSGHDVHVFGIGAGDPLLTIPCGRTQGLVVDGGGGSLLRAVAGKVMRLPFERPVAAGADPLSRFVNSARRLMDFFLSASLTVPRNLPALRAGPDFRAGELLAMAPSARRLFMAGNNMIDRLEPDSAMPLLWRPLPRPEGWKGIGDTRALACSIDGRRVALAGREKGRSLVRILEAEGGGGASTDVTVADPVIHAVAFTASGDAVIVGGSGEIVCLEIPSGSRRWMRPAQGPGGEGRVAVSRDGRMVAALVYPEVVSIYDPDTGASLADLRHPLGGRINGVAFSADSRHLAVLAGLRFHVWHLDELRRRGAMAARRE